MPSSPKRISDQNFVCISYLPTICHADAILHDYHPDNVLVERYKLYSFSLCKFFDHPVNFSLLGPMKRHSL